MVLSQDFQDCKTILLTLLVLDGFILTTLLYLISHFFYPVMTTVQIPFFYYYMLCFVCWTAVIGHYIFFL